VATTKPTRATLLGAAAAEIIDRGYTAASMSSIAARLGMTKGALAYHFPAKRDLAVALAEHLNASLDAAYRDAVAAFPGSGLRALVAYVFNVGEHCTSIQNAAGTVLAFDPVGHRLDLPATIPLLHRHLEDLLSTSDAHHERVDHAPDPRTAARGAAFHMAGAFVLQHRHPEDQRGDLSGVTMLLDAVGTRDTAAVVSDVAAAQERGVVPYPPVFERLVD